ncbi:ABC transporter permease [Kordia jejudonensis]|uniref:ABC transporter permease n=1 Tax=Kordia jejudonensis TaxID=1348245 RepID=UPI000629CFC2|nr:ABC transporter permease [Kordia jejudonensis]
MKYLTRNIVYLIFIIVLIVLWEYQANNSKEFRLLLSSPSLIWEFFQDETFNLLMATWTTFIEAFIGLLIATSFSFLIIVLCLYNKRLMSYILPVMIFSQVIPLITLAPLFIIIFGIGLKSKIMMATLICFFPIFVNFSNGIRLIDKNIHEMMFIYGATITQRIKRMYFPLALPNIMSGLKIATTLAIIGAIVAEFNGADIGLGKNLFLAAKRLEPELMMTSLILSSLLGGLLYTSIVLIEKKIGKWYLK